MNDKESFFPKCGRECGFFDVIARERESAVRHYL